MKEEKYIEAMLHYTRGIKINPSSPHLYSNRSQAFLHMGQYYQALEDVNTALGMMPKWAKVRT
jgi:tetratricopeptide (TPR) repeat protein